MIWDPCGSLDDGRQAVGSSATWRGRRRTTRSSQRAVLTDPRARREIGA